MTDLNQLDSKQACANGAWMQINSPVDGTPLKNEDDTPWRIKIMGKDSPVFIKRNHEFAKTRLLAAEKAGRLSGGADPDDLKRSTVDMMVALTVTWEGLILDEEVLEYSLLAAEKIYTQYPWLIEQLDRFVNDRGNYLGN